MLLAIDVGNTHTVFGVYRGESLVADWRVSSVLQQTDDEAGSHVKLLLADAGLQPKDITRFRQSLARGRGAAPWPTRRRRRRRNNE